MLADYPDTHTLEFGHVTGVLGSNIRYVTDLGYRIRNYCLTTKITRFSYVTSEAIHAFIAGCLREVEHGRKILISSPLDSNTTYQPEIKSGPIHDEYLQYYDQMGVPRSFYFYQLQLSDSEKQFIDENTLAQFSVESHVLNKGE